MVLYNSENNIKLAQELLKLLKARKCSNMDEKELTKLWEFLFNGGLKF